ncbi:response regulator [Brevibacterium renqingii]|uniref:response regulator n=1 Tax=Brevibacterium renqingii TaxID=2776916 RepID=UPI001ADFB7D0|nr:response regulator transcription factor [Brevibacterium renqingii]
MPGIGDQRASSTPSTTAGAGGETSVPPPASETIRVAIVDDQAMVRQGFGALLDAQTDMAVVGDAENGAQVVDLVRRTSPDVILMDIRMPQLNGLDATRAVFSMPGEHPKVIMLTTFDADEYVFSALRAGASGFLLKDATAEDMITAVRVVFSGESLLAPSVTRRLIAEYVAGPTVVKDTAVLGQLTDREVDVMALVAKGLANAEVAAELFLAEQTVKTHVSRILSKLGLRDRAQIVVAAYESGLVVAGG